MPEFRTQTPAHAIEQCSASILFQPAVPSKLLDKINRENTRHLERMGFKQAPAGPFMNVDIATGALSQATEGAPRFYLGPDGKTQVSIMPNVIALMTPQYVRWGHFQDLISRILGPICEAFNEVVSLNAVRLEYWDRFVWTGTWEDFDASLLIDISSGYIAPRVLEVEKEFHSHCGWFAYDGPVRRLVNINIDAQEGIQGSARIPSIGFYTMAQDQVASEDKQHEFEVTSVSEQFNNVHAELKKLFASLIVNEYAAKIGLTRETRGA